MRFLHSCLFHAVRIFLLIIFIKWWWSEHTLEVALYQSDWFRILCNTLLVDINPE